MKSKCVRGLCLKVAIWIYFRRTNIILLFSLLLWKMCAGFFVCKKFCQIEKFFLAFATNMGITTGPLGRRSRLTYRR
uniref:Uncharacterized protein n=1 Tax=Octopus bimaculoides TaxID=37653 RepID=A0A0L8G0V0_OCTBM